MWALLPKRLILEILGGLALLAGAYFLYLHIYDKGMAKQRAKYEQVLRKA